MNSYNQTCSICGALFCCDNLAGKNDCWCFKMPAINTKELNPLASCLCPECLKQQHLKSITAPVAK